MGTVYSKSGFCKKQQGRDVRELFLGDEGPGAAPPVRDNGPHGAGQLCHPSQDTSGPWGHAGDKEEVAGAVPSLSLHSHS